MAGVTSYEIRIDGVSVGKKLDLCVNHERMFTELMKKATT